MAMRLKTILSKLVSPQQFEFLKGWLIDEAMGSTHEGFHSIKMKNKLVYIIKINISNTYDQVTWLYLRLQSLHIGF
jgi:hypothetical protein